MTDPIRDALRARNMPAAFVACFAHMAAAARRGPGHVRESEIEPVERVPSLDTADAPEASDRDCARAVAITLNGGLGTTMGMRAPKSLLLAGNGLTFLDITLRQAAGAGARPLLMNSFATDRAVRAAAPGTVATFLQHEAPKLRRSDFLPVSDSGHPELEWCPPGHGDVYTALGTSGWLERLRDQGYRYAFVSNVDNVGGYPDPAILARFIDSGAPLLVEVVRRAADDWKGGHLARRRSDGRLILRETAQCHPEDVRFFRDADRHRYFNANNLWLRLDALADLLAERGGFLPLPTIVNPKTLNPRDPDSTPVFHLEQAAGSALEVFDGAIAMEAPRRRFAPVKTTENLLVLRSDIYRIGENGVVAPNRAPPPVHLDADRYRFVTDLEDRFPHGPPSLIDCDRLEVRGDVRFGRNVACEGDVRVLGAPGRRGRIPDDARLRGTVRV